MSILLKSFLPLLATALSGCTSYSGLLASRKQTDYSILVECVLPPGEGEALVYFLRVGRYEDCWALLAVIYDGDDFAGFVPSNTMFPYYADTGSHLFMAYADEAGAKPTARFLQAEFEEGRIYYIVIYPEILSCGFSLQPLREYGLSIALDADYYYNWMKNARVVENKDTAYAWARQNHQQVLKTKAKYMKKWNAKPDKKKAYLAADEYLEIDLHDPKVRK